MGNPWTKRDGQGAVTVETARSTNYAEHPQFRLKEIVQMSDPRDERELTTDLEIRTPSWLPGGRIGLHYGRIWDKRADRLVGHVAKTANVDEDALLQRVAEGDGFADVFQTAGRRVIEDGDPVLQDVLTRLIASALQDDTRIHEISYMLTKLERFQPIHIRTIMALPYDASSSDTPANLTLEVLTRKVNANGMLVESALGELVTDNFVFYERTYDSAIRLESLGVALRHLIHKYR